MKPRTGEAYEPRPVEIVMTPAQAVVFANELQRRAGSTSKR